MSRDKHEFQFTADWIAKAAFGEAEYHRDRESYWKAEYASAVSRVKETAGVEVRTFPVTGGERADVVVNYGDPAAYKRMGEAFDKQQQHRVAAERYETEGRIYGTQGQRTYELSPDDVHYFRLGNEARPT